MNVSGINRIGGFVLGCILVTGGCERTQAASTNATAQLRRTIEDSERGAAGWVRFRKSGTRQMVDVNIKALFPDDFKLYITTNLSSSLIATSDFVFGVAPLDRTSERGGKWRRRLVGDGAAPVEIPIFTDVADLAGRQVFIARPGADLTVPVTNLLNCVTNIVNATTNVNCNTNITVGLPLVDAGLTGVVSSVLWAPVPEFLAQPAVSNLNLRAVLALPGPPNPSPNARGIVRTRINYARGQSVLEVRCSGLTRGQNYSVWIEDADGVVLVEAGAMELRSDGASARFVRDTKFGDPLPQQVGFVSELSGRLIVILDEFEDVHLTGTIP